MAKELKEEKLNDVTGGNGSGRIPSCGLIYQEYDVVNWGFYYTSTNSLDDAVYVQWVDRHGPDGPVVLFTKETIEISSDRFNSTSTSGKMRMLETDFKNMYRYVLNIMPE